MKLVRSRVGVVAAVLAGSVGALLGVSPASAAQVVTLSASDTTPGPNQGVTLTATATPQPTGVTWYGIDIYEQNTNTRVGGCSYQSTCSVTLSRLFGAYTYVAVASSWASPGPTRTEGVSNPVTVYWGLGSTPPPSGLPSNYCDSGIQVVNNTSGGGNVKVYVLHTSTQTDICYRVDAAGTGRGGRIRIIHGTPTVGAPTVGVPTVDGNVSACTSTPNNQLPVPNPLASGGVGGVVDYLVTGYANTSSGAMLCATVENINARVNVPFNVTGPTITPNIDIQHTAD